jgi:hypothetical protein
MSDIPDNTKDSKDTKDISAPDKAAGPSKNAESMIRKGIPIDDDVRMDLYDLRNKGASSAELGEMVKNLPKNQGDQIRESTTASGKGLSVDDIKGNETLAFPHKPAKPKEEK